ncbi:hypothetical protein BG015_010431 [Linnemannia schmuckeri]|uniref:Arm-like repeat domain-containing protein n=1 Tax=Linnemannia schmuckeri TaxID=64567 RepID=A0A9P5RU16_9FUNG|nr:hypothetical protein BG015_010431 [Linnemannia schmuckeri]
MTTTSQGKGSAIPRPTPTSDQSRFTQLEEAAKKLLRFNIGSKKRTVPNALASIQFGTIEKLIPQEYAGSSTSTTATTATTATAVSTNITISAYSPPAISQPWLHVFPTNVSHPSLQVTLPPPGARLETTLQLAYCNNLLRTHLSPSSAIASISGPLDPSQQASIDAILNSEEEQDHIREITIRVIEEWVHDSLKTSEKISEVVLLGPYLDQEYYRKLLNCFIAEFETARLFDIDLLQGLDVHQQTAKHLCYLSLALSRFLDVMVEGKVRDLRRVVDNEPLSAMLGQMMESPNPFLKHQATYALQGLRHIPDDETRRQYILRQAGNITMGLLGVVSVCKLDLSELRDGADHLYKTAGEAHEVSTKMIDSFQALRESDQDITTSIKAGILFGGRRLWYAALREAQEHVRNGQLTEFNRLVFAAPCRQDVEFQWGVCQLLGEIALDPQWDAATRQHAIDFLAELYRSSTNLTSMDEVLRWILTIIRQVAALLEIDISEHARLMLQSLERDGNSAKQALCRDLLASPHSAFHVKISLSAPQKSSPILSRVQDIPYLEYDLHRLRSQRLKERENVLYIPPQAKPSLRSSDDTLFPLMETTLEFLAGPGVVFLLLGDSGGGKSTFNLQLEHTLWKEYKRGGAIPLHINLPSINNPQDDMIDKQLRRLHSFSDAQIQELRQSRQFIVICDGYDESQLRKNLYATNRFNQPGQWRAKMIISCRSQYLGPDYHARFQPALDPYQKPVAKNFQEAVIAPFSRDQIEQYVEQFVQQLPPHAVDTAQTSWTTKGYMNKLIKIPGLIELVSNPFLLTLALRALPMVVRSEKSLSEIRLTRVELYDTFTEQWLETNKRRLEGSLLSLEAQATFDNLLEAGFIQCGISYQKDLASAIFQHQDGAPVVEYTNLRESRTWKAAFFSPDSQATLLRESSPISRSANQYRFLHRSILEYFYSRVVSDPFNCNRLSEHETATSESSETFASHPLNQRSIVEEPSILQFLAERVELDVSFKICLLTAIEDSKTNETISQAAANAISILVRAGTRFNGADLRGIMIQGADLCGGQFDSANFEGANLSGVNLTKTWLRQANFDNTRMSGVQFGELPHLVLAKNSVVHIVFSYGGDLLTVSTERSIVVVFDTVTWTIIAAHPGGGAIDISPTTRELAKGGKDSTVELGDILTGELRLVLTGHDDEVTCITYSLDGTQIATASKDATARIWSTLSGDTLYTLRGHHEAVFGVAFSPTGLHLVTCSKDKTIRTWDTQTGEPLFILNGHTDPVLCVTYSPDGRQIASGDKSNAVALWSAKSGELLHGLSRPVGMISDVAFSLDGRQVASCGEDGTVRLWDVSTGECVNILSGHLFGATSVAYSPTGGFIASGSVDETVRLWKIGTVFSDAEWSVNPNAWQNFDMSPDGVWVVTSNCDGGAAQLWETWTGEPGAILKGHTEAINEVAFSPCGQKIVSAGDDTTVRLWCARTGVSLQVLKGHTECVVGVAFSPCGRQIVSCSNDRTLRTWDIETGASGHILEGHIDTVRGATYSPSGHQIASCSDDKTLRLWCAQTGTQLFVMDHSAEVDRVAFSPDGQELVSVSMSYSELCCWDPQFGGRLEKLDLEAKSYGVFCCCYSPIGKQLVVTAGTDGMMRVWDRSSDHGHWLEVFQTMVGIIFKIQWRQSNFEDSYLVTLGVGSIRVWRLVEVKGSYSLRLVWSMGKKELSFENTNLCGAVGLSPVDLKLAKQRGAITAPGACQSNEP